jgi:fluoride exporter
VKFLLVMIGGGLGALCRYGVNHYSVRLLGNHFPFGTLLVNLLGCLLIGITLGLAGKSSLVSHSTRLFFVTGFLGALTTFSSYAMETVGAGSVQVAIVNILVNNILGLALVVAGMWVTQYVV